MNTFLLEATDYIKVKLQSNLDHFVHKVETEQQSMMNGLTENFEFKLNLSCSFKIPQFPVINQIVNIPNAV